VKPRILVHFRVHDINSFLTASFQKQKHGMKIRTRVFQGFLRHRDELSCACDPRPSLTGSPSISARGSSPVLGVGARKASLRGASACLWTFWVKDTTLFYLQHLWFATLAVLRTTPGRHQRAFPSSCFPQFCSKSGARAQTIPSESDPTDSAAMENLTNVCWKTISAASGQKLKQIPRHIGFNNTAFRRCRFWGW